jgi:hypothetical protein
MVAAEEAWLRLVIRIANSRFQIPDSKLEELWFQILLKAFLT